METNIRNRWLLMLIIGALTIMTPQWARALTPACTPVLNAVALSYSVGGVPQTGINSATSFTVGNKVNLVVTRTDASYVAVPPGAINQTLSFLVTNTGNANQRYRISYTEPIGGADPFGGTDNFNATTPGIGAVSVASVTTGVIAPGETYAATIVSNIPIAQVDGDIGVYGLLARTLKVDGTTLETGNAGSITSSYGTCSTDIVLADTAGTDDITGARDGAHSERGAYQVASSVLSFSKTATTIWDPVNYNSSPKAIPGALVRYVVTISNAAGAANATLDTITDTLSSDLVIDPDLKVPSGAALAALANESAAGDGFKITHVSGRTLPTPNYFTTTADGDGVDITGQVITATMGTVLPAQAGYAAGELQGGESVALTFNVIIQ